MQRKCAYCETEIDLKAHGSTNYCSKLCRSRAAAQRTKQISQIQAGNDLENERHEEAGCQTQESQGTKSLIQGTGQTNNPGGGQSSYGQYAPTHFKNQQPQDIFSYIPPQLIGMYDERFKLHVQIQQLVADNARLDERTKQLERDKTALEQKVADMQMEIDTLESQLDSEEDTGGKIFGIPQDQIGQAVLPLIMNYISKQAVTTPAPQTNNQ